MSSQSNEEKAKYVGQIPSGLFIVCAQDPQNEKIDGYLASFIQQVSFEPLLISLAIKPGRPAYDLIQSGQHFSINIVGDERSFLKHFWSGYDPNKDVFTEIPHKKLEEGAIQMDQALSCLVCKKVSSANPGDHEIVFAEVLASYGNESEGKPMIHLRKSGLSY